MKHDRINALNIGLMLLAAALACVVPFEMFLVAYAVLGPLHYLTELSWLHDRKYYAPHWREVAILVFVSLVAIAVTGYFHTLLGAETVDPLTIRLSNWSAEIALAGLGVAWIAVVVRGARARSIALAALPVALVAVHFVDKQVRGDAAFTTYSVLLDVYLATVLHVFVFTGAFLLYGSLKDRSRSGYASCVVFVACAVACLYLPASAGYALGSDDVAAYRMTALGLLQTLAVHLPGIDHGTLGTRPEDVFLSADAVRVGRFIAFAYTYHYLNWFSKTSVIRWHDVSRARFATVLGLWAAGLALYAYDFKTGLTALFGLSLLHVYMEFPLNWHSFRGIGRELRGRMKSS